MLEFARRHLFRSVVVFVIVALTPLLPTAVHVQPAAPPVVFAAASLKTVLDAIASDWRKDTGRTVTISYASSSALARQVEQGAPADIFFSADPDWIDRLQQRSLIKTSTRETLLGNTLVLIARSEDDLSLKLAPGVDFAAVLGDRRLSIGEVKAVPAGKYAKEALERLGLWTSIENKLAQVETVRAALAFVARGEARLGIVYATDAKAEPKVKIVDSFPTLSHAPIVYPLALTASSINTEAVAFLTYLKSPAASQRFVEQGFSIVAH
jgi:molybdate transport system substrate-binding protein